MLKEEFPIRYKPGVCVGVRAPLQANSMLSCGHWPWAQKSIGNVKERVSEGKKVPPLCIGIYRSNLGCNSQRLSTPLSALSGLTVKDKGSRGKFIRVFSLLPLILKIGVFWW